MNFEQMFTQLKNGQNCCRKAWSGAKEGVYIAAQYPNQDIDESIDPIDEGVQRTINVPYIYYVGATGSVSPWIPNACDMFGSDWVVID